MSSNQRVHARLEQAVLVRLVDVDGGAFEYATNLSAGGLFLQTTRRFALGNSLRVEVTSRERAWILTAQARVVRVEAAGIGLALEGLSDDDMAALAEDVNQGLLHQEALQVGRSRNRKTPRRLTQAHGRPDHNET